MAKHLERRAVVHEYAEALGVAQEWVRAAAQRRA